MSQAASGSSVAVSPPEAPLFPKLRAHLADTAFAALLNDLSSVAAEVRASGAPHASSRLFQLDEYATVLPPEALPRLVDRDAALDELEQATGKGFGRWVLARNIFALFPLLLTWFSLFLATSAYHDEIHRDPNQVYQPFLVLWQNGFGGRLWLTFSNVALADAALFLVIIFMTWMIHHREHQARTRALLLSSRVDRIVLALVAALGQQRWLATNNPADWAAAVQRVIDQAMAETRELNRANQQALESARLAIHEAKQSHTELIRELGAEVVQTLTAVRQENMQLITLTAQELRDMLAQAFAGHKQVADESLAAVSEARTIIQQSSEQAQFTFAELQRGSLAALERLHEEDQKFLVGVGSETRDLLQGLHSELELYRQSASSLAGSIGQIGQVAQKLGANAEIFAGTATAMDEHVRSVAQSQERFAGKLAEAADATRLAVNDMSSATREMRDTATQVRQVLAAVSDDLSPQLQHMGAQVRVASDAMAQTQARLAETSTGLARAAEYFRNMPRPRVVLSLFGKPAI